MYCAQCKKRPDELNEYIYEAKLEGVTPDEFVASNEGTFNAVEQVFWCTECYLELGLPLGVAHDLAVSS